MKKLLYESRVLCCGETKKKLCYFSYWQHTEFFVFSKFIAFLFNVLTFKIQMQNYGSRLTEKNELFFGCDKNV